MPLTKEQGKLFVELINRTDWCRDAKRLVEDMLDDGFSIFEIRQFAQEIDATVAEINSMLPEDEGATIAAEKTLDHVLMYELLS